MKNTHSSNSLEVFSTSVQVGRMPFANSISRGHFLLMLKIVWGSRVPLSSSLTAFIILEILDGGTFASHKMFINCSSLSDKSFCDSNAVIVMLQRTATMKVPLLVRAKNQYNSHRTLFGRRCCTLSDTPSRMSSLNQLHLVLSLIGFLLSSYFSFCLWSHAIRS